MFRCWISRRSMRRSEPKSTRHCRGDGVPALHSRTAGAEVRGGHRQVLQDAPHGVGVSSGTDALLICLMAEGIGPGDEVITTPYTFFATAGSIARVGANPVFVDIDPVHLQPGSGADRAADHGADAGHHPGASLRSDGRHGCRDAGGREARAGRHRRCGAGHRRRIHRAGGPGRSAITAAFRSFPSKNLGAAGDGGMVVTNRMRARAENLAAAGSWLEAQVLPQGHRRQLPPGRAPGRGRRRQTAAPGRLDGRSSAQRRAV